MSTLNLRFVSNTFKDLLHIENSNLGLDGTLRTVESGEGSSSILKLSTSTAQLGNIQFTGNSISSPTTNNLSIAATTLNLNGMTFPTADGTNGYLLSTNGSGTLSWVTSPSSADIMLGSNNLSDVDNAATARTNLGLAIGVDVQAYDAELAAIAGLTSAADRVPYFTGSGTAALATFTSFGRSLVDDADASAARTTLGLGTMATEATGTYLAKANNLSDLPSASTARTNLGLGSIATAATSDYCATANNLSDLASAATARTNLGLAIGTNVQAHNAGLTSLAALTDPNNDRILFWDDSAGDYKFLTAGTGLTITGTTIEASAGGGSLVAANNLSDLNDASIARTNLGVEIGVNVQAQDAELAAIAGLTSAADRVPYFTGSGTAALATFTSFGRSLVDDADAATARATLDLEPGTDVQAYNANLAAIAGLSDPNADRILFWDDSAGAYTHLEVGSGLSVTGTTLSASGGSGDLVSTNNLSDVANVATARDNLGLEIGSDVQAYDAELAALAGLTSAADRVPYFTGSGTAALATFTSFGRSLVDDADAPAARTTLGLGTIATAASTDYLPASSGQTTSIIKYGPATNKYCWGHGIFATGSSGSSAYAVDRLYICFIYIPISTTMTRIGIETTIAGTATAVRLGIYNMGLTGTSDNPMQATTLISDCGTVAGAGTGAKEITISQTLSGWYALAFLMNGTMTCRGHLTDGNSGVGGVGINGIGCPQYNVVGPSVSALADVGYYYTYTYGTLPNDMTGNFTAANDTALVYLRKV